MRHFVTLTLLVAVFSFGDAFSKYGRTCKDIGCPSNQKCVMRETPCSYNSRDNQCGLYPTCARVSNTAATCASYVCPPTMKCRMDRGVPKCFAGKRGKALQGTASRSGFNAQSEYQGSPQLLLSSRYLSQLDNENLENSEEISAQDEENWTQDETDKFISKLANYIKLQNL